MENDVLGTHPDIIGDGGSGEGHVWDHAGACLDMSREAVGISSPSSPHKIRPAGNDHPFPHKFDPAGKPSPHT